MPRDGSGTRFPPLRHANLCVLFLGRPGRTNAVRTDNIVRQTMRSTALFPILAASLFFCACDPVRFEEVVIQRAPGSASLHVVRKEIEAALFESAKSSGLEVHRSQEGSASGDSVAYVCTNPEVESKHYLLEISFSDSSASVFFREAYSFQYSGAAKRFIDEMPRALKARGYEIKRKPNKLQTTRWDASESSGSPPKPGALRARA
jgi:hypothetical protein